ncbi:MAG: OmpH family outer membrane protein [Phycisphaerales bacterium]
MSLIRAPRINLTAIACCAMICGTVLIAGRSHAVRLISSMRSPAVVATIDLERVMTQVDLFSAGDREIQALGVSLDAELQAQRDSIEVMTEDAELLTGVAREDKLRELELAAENLRVAAQFAEYKVRAARSAHLREIYNQVKTVSASMAAANQWDVVIVNDSLVALPEIAPEDEMMRQISARRIIFADGRIDVTQMLVDAINAG